MFAKGQVNGDSALFASVQHVRASNTNRTKASFYQVRQEFGLVIETSAPEIGTTNKRKFRV